MKGPVVMVKLGGSLITNKNTPFSARNDIIRRLVEEILAARTQRPDIHIVLGNGGGSYPHYPAHEYDMGRGIVEERQKKGFCLVQDAAAQLNRLIVRELLDHDVNAVGCTPSSMIVSRNGKIREFFTAPIKGYLDLGLIPVLYGDIIYDEETGSHIFSTESLLSELSIRFAKQDIPVKRIIQVCKVDGVLDGNGAVVPRITRSSFPDVEPHISAVEGFDVTGGMKHKIEESLSLADRGIRTHLIGGMQEGNLLKALLDTDVIGTVIG